MRRTEKSRLSGAERARGATETAGAAAAGASTATSASGAHVERDPRRVHGGGSGRRRGLQRAMARRGAVVSHTAAAVHRVRARARGGRGETRGRRRHEGGRQKTEDENPSHLGDSTRHPGAAG